MATKNSQKLSSIFTCFFCDYTTSRTSDYKKHVNTMKHRSNTLATKNSQNSQNFCHEKSEFICDNCKKPYVNRSGLWRHKQNCYTQVLEQDSSSDKDVIVKLLKQNNELLEVLKNGSNNTTNSHNINSNNKTFNLQIFLNETCKDAMNIMEFIESIKLQLSDLDNVGEIGYVEGISNIITTNLKALDITQRPIHCTDKKREILYIKDQDKWEKDDENNKMRKAIKKIANKNIKMLTKFKEEYPDCGKSDSIYSDKYNKLIIEAMGGNGDNEIEKEDKIIKNIVKNIGLVKENV